MFNTLLGAAVGAGLMYVMDPVSGARRRALLRDQLLSATGEVEDARSATLRDMRNRATGIWAEVRRPFTGERVPDELLEQRIRAGMGMRVRFPRLIQVEAHGGVVTLTGDVPADEVQQLVRYVRSVRGVQRVDNALTVHDDPARMPGVQPPIPPRPVGPRLDVFQERWAPSTRFWVGAGGLTLMMAGGRFTAGIGTAMIALGTLALLRAATNRPLFTAERRDGQHAGQDGSPSHARAGVAGSPDSAW